MNREIKFRAWVEFEKTMHPVEQWSNKSWIAVPIQVSEDDWELEQRKMEDVVLLQYTGLKDKNGKEIYEGDIIAKPKNHEVYRWEEEGRCFPIFEDLHDIVFDKNGFFGKPRTLTGRGLLGKDPGHDRDASEYEIIGNIYENPELLANE